MPDTEFLPLRLDDAFLESLRGEGDPSLDPIMADLVRQGQLKAVRAGLDQLLFNGQKVPASLPADLREWLETQMRLPPWSEREPIDRATRFLADRAISVAVILSTVSLLQVYTLQKGVKALHVTDQLGYSGALKRLGSTMQFCANTFTPGGLFAGGQLIPLIMKVRLMHAVSRYYIQQTGWPEEELGVPICQEDLLATLMSFARTPLRYLPKAGLKVSGPEAEDVLYYWRILGELLGIRPDIIPRSVPEADAVNAAIYRRHQGRSDEGVALAQALLKELPNLFPVPSQFPGRKAFESLFPALVRHLMGDAECDLLEVPRSPWTILVRQQTLVGKIWDATQRRFKFVNDLTTQLGLALLHWQGQAITGQSRPVFKVPRQLEAEAGESPTLEDRQ